MEQYARGAEWRRWDLHIHTPGTQKEEQFRGATLDEKWDNYYEDIKNYIGDGSDPLKSIAVIGITDYMSLDNYQKVIADKRLPDSIKLVIPNVEMRISPLAKGTPINIHCLFNPAICSNLETRFFSKLKFDYNGRTYGATHYELTELGRTHTGNRTLDEKAAYKEGIKQYVLEWTKIKEVFDEDQDLRENTIIVISNSTNDGVSGIISHSDYMEDGSSQLDATRNALYYFTDMIFSSKPSDINYFLGKKSDSVEEIIRKYRSLKPCIHGCDAHTNAKIFNPDNNRYCWIKADPTFNGLRQVLYEPETRVCISPIKPETKSDYQVIDRVEISDSDFSPTPIYFNDKLTCIIGGKSTGKSLLLNNIAMTIDPDQVKEKRTITSTKGKEIQQLSVIWSDGSVVQSGDTDTTHKIVYIPQTYLNRLSDDHEEITEIDKIIHNIIMINADAAQAFKEMNASLSKQKLELDKKIYEVLHSHQTWSSLKDSLAELGTKSGIEKEIAKLKAQKEKIAEDTELSEADIQQYDEASKNLAISIRALQKLNTEIQVIENTNHILSPIPVPDELSDETKILFNAAIETIQTEADKLWITQRATILQSLSEKKATLETAQNSAQSIVTRLTPLIKGHDALNQLSEQIKEEEKHLLQFIDQEKQVTEKRTSYEQSLTELAKYFNSFKTIHQIYADAINHNNELTTDDLEFSATVQFRGDAFGNTILSLFDGRKLRSHKDFIDPDNISLEQLSESYLEKLLSYVIEGTLSLVRGQSLENALREILGDWFNSAYQVVMDNDPIEDMSPGKKALVLLKMLINLAESKCPILIDQPEDDLDNRSIFDELIPFIKKKKLNRQIIIVTHNANVVLGSDAEEIIVANQQGKNAPNKQYRFEYRSGSIEDDLPISGELNTTLGKQGIQQHICDVLEGGKVAFDLRLHKYRM